MQRTLADHPGSLVAGVLPVADPLKGFVASFLLAGISVAQSTTTTRVSVDSSGAQANDGGSVPSISADGRYVAFASGASNLVPGDTNGTGDIFVRDRVSGTTERASVDSTGAEGNGPSYWPSISANGRYVAFYSYASNLVPGDTNGPYPSGIDIFVRDRQSGTTERVSVDSTGAQGNGGASYWPSMSADGRYVAFDSDAFNLVPGDTNESRDAFVHDRNAVAFTSLCAPGVAGVLSCPCSNPPSGVGRGCDNTSSTGGAQLSAAGVAYLSMDSLVFTTSGEISTTASVLVQGSLLLGSGAVYGRGVRCIGGTIRPLFTKTASNGSITAPDFGAGDPTVSARSAATGDMIQAGSSRWYIVAYRDPIAACPAAFTASPIHTFNSTQTGRVDWSL